MDQDFRKKHKAPKGWFGHTFLLILGMFLLWQPWFPELKYWPILLILIPIVMMTVSHLKQRRRRKIIEAKKNGKSERNHKNG